MPMLGVFWILGLTGNVHISITYIFDVLISWQVTGKLKITVFLKQCRFKNKMKKIPLKIMYEFSPTNNIYENAFQLTIDLMIIPLHIHIGRVSCNSDLHRQYRSLR